MSDPVNRAFAGSAATIGAAYVLIVYAVRRLFGPEAAGVAGVALAALATAVFREYENLHFKRAASAEGWSVEIPRINLAYAGLLLSACLGIQGFVSVVAALGVRLLSGTDVTYKTLNLWLGRLGYERYLMLMAVSFFLAGLLAGRTAPVARYFYATVVSLTYIALLVIALAIAHTEVGSAGTAASILGQIALVFVGCATAGAWCGFRSR